MASIENCPHSQQSETIIALYSIDCVRKLLLSRHYDNKTVFARLDEAREAEMRRDDDFWKSSQEVNS